MQIESSCYRDYNITEPKFKLFLFQLPDKEDIILGDSSYTFSDTSTFYSNFDISEFFNGIKCRLEYLIKSNQCYIDKDVFLHFNVTNDNGVVILGGSIYHVELFIK